MLSVPLRRWALVVAGAVALAAAAVAAPDRTQAGGKALLLNGEGTRERLGVDVYEVALYLPTRTVDPSVVASPDVAKALRYEMRWSGPVPDEHPDRWQEELRPVLNEAQTRALRENLDTLGEGDVLWIFYVPGEGTTVQQGEQVLVRDPSHDVMQAYLDLWVGEDPVSDDLREALLTGWRGGGE